MNRLSVKQSYLSNIANNRAFLRHSLIDEKKSTQIPFRRRLNHSQFFILFIFFVYIINSLICNVKSFSRDMLEIKKKKNDYYCGTIKILIDKYTDCCTDYADWHGVSRP